MSITSVTSEALQLKLRQLLPSQQGFGDDLTASNTILPIIDLTDAAEGSDVSEYLQTAISFGSQTTFSINNGSAVLANSPGFYRIFGVSSCQNINAGPATHNSITMTDGATTKTILKFTTESGGSTGTAVSSINIIDFTVFLGVGESISGVSNNVLTFLDGSVRQVADTNGTLIQPVGFNPQ